MSYYIYLYNARIKVTGIDLIILIVLQITWLASLLDFTITHGFDGELGPTVEALLGLHHGHREQRPPPSVESSSVRVVDHKQQRLLLASRQLLLLGNTTELQLKLSTLIFYEPYL